MKKVLFILSVVFLLLSMPCLAIKVNTKNKVNFEPNLEKSFKICVTIMKYDYEAHLNIIKKSQLAKYVTLEEDILYFDKPGTQCTRYHLSLPEEMDVFGTKRVYIRAKEINPNQKKGFFVMIPSMNHPLEIIIPFPGKYVSGSISAQDTEEGMLVPITINLKAKGKETIESASSSITIFDVNNNSIAMLQTPTIYDLLPGNTSKININWSSAGRKSGTYRAEATLSYSNQTSTFGTTFHLGGLNVEILEHTQNMTNGSIKPIKVTVQSQWTDPIGEVYLDIEMNGKKTKTPHQTIKPWAPTDFVGYIDATTFPVGETDLKVTVHYENKATIYEGKIQVIQHPTTESKFDISMTTILVVVIALLVALNIVWFIFYRMKKNKKAIDDHAHQATLDESFKNEKK